MSKPATYTPEVATRLGRLVLDLEPKIRGLEAAARACLGFAHGLQDTTACPIPEDLMTGGVLYLASDCVDKAGELQRDCDDLLSLAVRNVLPENDPERKAKEAAHG